jgi:nitroreductase
VNMTGPREPSATEVDQLFLERWSPRTFLPAPPPDAHIQALFEAARWSPSSMNEQPWLFVYAARGDGDFSVFQSLLNDKNRSWALDAPFLTFLFSRRHHAKNQALNETAAFDTGAAWMSLALQARRLNIYTRAMVGIHKEATYAALGVSRDDYEVHIGIAAGYLDESRLPADQARSQRKPLEQIVRRGIQPEKIA